MLRDELWNYMKEIKPDIYEKVNHTFIGKGMQMRGPVGKRLLLLGYAVTRKILAYN